MHKISQATVEPFTNQLTTTLDPTIRLGISFSPQTSTMATYHISPITMGDPICPHYLVPPLTSMLGPMMNLTPYNLMGPTTIADSTIMEGPIDLVKLCPTAPLLDHTAEGIPSKGNPIIMPTTMAGLTNLNSPTPTGCLNMVRALPSTLLRGPTTQEDLVPMLAIMGATKPLIMVSIPTTESIITTESTITASILTTESIPIIDLRASPNCPAHSCPPVHLVSPLLIWAPKAQSTVCLSPTWQFDLIPLVVPAEFIPKRAPKNQTPGATVGKSRSAKVSLYWACNPDSRSLPQMHAGPAQALNQLPMHQEAAHRHSVSHILCLLLTVPPFVP